MGIKISEIVTKQVLDFNDLSNKKIAVDSSNMIFQFISSIRQQDGTLLMDNQGRTTSHLVGIFSRVTNLMQKDIKLAFVFDGKPPALKFTEQENRRSAKSNAEEKLSEVDKEDLNALLKYSKQTAKLTKDMVSESKELLTALGLPVVQADSEAEAQAAYLCKKGRVWAVASTDYDNLVYGAPRMIESLTLSNKRKTSSGVVMISPKIIYIDEVLKKLEINQKQLLYLAILVGTDFNPGGVKGIGPKKALKLVKEYNDPKILFKLVSPELDWKEIVDVFEKMPVKDVDLKWGEVDQDRVRKILVDDHDFSLERVNKTLEKLCRRDKGQRSLGDF